MRAARSIGRKSRVRGAAGDAARGLILLADGVGGMDLCGLGMRRALARSGSSYALRVIRWGHGYGRWYADLSNTQNHRAGADSMAELVARQRLEHPDAPIFLLGKSGGSAIVLGCLERLPENAVETTILLAPAVSPEYELAAALKATRNMVAFWSPFDVVILGLGTAIFGTVDRQRRPAAGLVGFKTKRNAGGAELERLIQVKWRSEMASSGYWGGHIGPDHPAFLGRYVIPLLRPGLDRRAIGELVGVKPADADADNVTVP